MQNQALDARLVEIESQVAENERLISDLSEVERGQWSEIELLKKELEAVTKQVAILTGSIEDSGIRDADEA
jgi:uncharacterized coiled-coil protein SlyX